MIAIGSDHTSLRMKEEISAYVRGLGYEVKDFGTFTEERTYFVIPGEKAARAVASGECEKGVLICGSGVGMGVCANKVRGIRCVTCSEPYSAMMSRKHNNANMITFGSRVVGIEVAKLIIKTWLETDYEGGRHQEQIDRLAEMEERQ